MRTFAVILLVLLGILFFTNPGYKEFENYLKKKAVEQVREETGLNDEVAAGLVSLFTGLTAKAFVRDNYLIFSVYRMGDYKILGIAGQFIPLSKFDEKALQDMSAEGMDEQLQEQFSALQEELEKITDTLDWEKMQRELEKAGEEFLEQLKQLQEAETQ